jgi:hypothetical protein
VLHAAKLTLVLDCRIIGEIKHFYGVPDEIPTDLRSLIEAFPDWLTEAAKRGGLLLVLDALNQLEDRGKVRFWPPKKGRELGPSNRFVAI